MNIVVIEETNPEEALKGFFDMLQGVSGQCKLIGQKFADLRGVPYLEDKETREKDEERKNYPTSCNDVSGALKRLSKLTAVYYHYPSMNLVLVDESGEQIGIRSIDLTLGFAKKEQVES